MHRACVHHASAFPVLCPSLGDDHHASFRSYPIIRPLIASFQGSNRAGCTRSDCVCLGTVPVSGRDGVASACAKMLAQYGPSSSTSAKKLAQHAQKRRNWDVVSALGELFRAHAHIKPRRANFFAHRTQRHGGFETNDTSATTDAGQRETAITTAHPSTATVETNNTSATEKRTKNTHFSPAKATPVSDNRAT